MLRALFTAVELMEVQARKDRVKQLLPVNHGQPWKETEDAKLLEMHRAGCPVSNIAYELKRTKDAILLRLEKLGAIPA